MTRRAILSMSGGALLAMLNGCHQDQKATGHGTVSGEIMPGSISDAMLPFDSVKSKAPLAPVEPTDQVETPAAVSDATSTDSAAAESSSPADVAVSSE